MSPNGFLQQTKTAVEWNEENNRIIIRHYLNDKESETILLTYDQAREVFDGLHFLFKLSRYPEIR